MGKWFKNSSEWSDKPARGADREEAMLEYLDKWSFMCFEYDGHIHRVIGMFSIDSVDIPQVVCIDANKGLSDVPALNGIVEWARLGGHLYVGHDASFTSCSKQEIEVVGPKLMKYRSGLARAGAGAPQKTLSISLDGVAPIAIAEPARTWERPCYGCGRYKVTSAEGMPGICQKCIAPC
jgi:hypothetical protein